LNNLAKKLAKRNKEEGALSFSQEEVKFILGDNKKIVDVRIKTMGETNTLIENFMLLANKTVTEYVQKIIPEKERLFLYRIHDKPDKDRVLELIGLLRGLGYTLRLKDGAIESNELNKILASSVDTPEANMIQMATIRTMAKAIYSIQNIGHFGLSFENYTQFTSPIRRYPDIIVHRLIDDYQHGKRVPQEQWEKYSALARDLSDKERNAMEAERGSIRYKQIEYLQERTADTFEGIISSITEWGIYVEESRTKAEGLIRIGDLGDDYYVYDKSKMSLIGTRTKKAYRLGDTVQVKIRKIDNEARTIDYVLAQK
jgi:VacB/RNase II family 3'-5' exoribonuclease